MAKLINEFYSSSDRSINKTVDNNIPFEKWLFELQ